MNNNNNSPPSASNTTPGAGWSNGDFVHSSMFPVTRNGRMSLYSSHRRWINLNHGWARVGGTDLDGNKTHELSRRTSFSMSGESVIDTLEEEAQSIRSLISQLCERFYEHGWATGTGGGVSIRTGGPSENRPWRVFVAPSGIQKEDMIGDDIFELDMDRNVVVPPKTPNLRQSACTPLWYVVYKYRPSVRCVIHTHSIHAQMATLLDPTETSKSLKITHLEMLKGVGNHAFDDVLEVPIIDNRPSEDLLAAQLEQVIVDYPLCNAVLVRRHGLYAWGDSWEQAKTQCESFDYLFESAVQMKQMGIDYSAIPTSGTYRVQEEQQGVSNAERPAKKSKIDSSEDAATTGGFHGKGNSDNAADLSLSSSVPLLPRDSKILLLDIEGCTTAISFVKETLFPYVEEILTDYLINCENAKLELYHEKLNQDVESLPKNHPSLSLISTADESTNKCQKIQDAIGQIVLALMKHDVKATGLKMLQGDMWKSGYESGKLKGHVYEDFVPLLDWCKSQGIQVNIYSSGSIPAQKLLFGFSEKGDLTRYLNAYFDTTSGSKKDAQSYKNIAAALKCSPSDICFVSDAETELVAAEEAGIGSVVMSIRPGNAPLTAIGKKYPAVQSLLQLCGV